MAFTLYDTTELVAMISPIRIVGNFLRSLYFSAAPITFSTPDIKMDRVFEDLRIAPFVSPYAPAKPTQDKGYQVESFVPAYLKPMDRVDPTKLTKRRPGEAFGGEFSLAERRDMMMVDYLEAHKKRLERRDEVMAAQIVRTGAVIIVGDDYPSATVDFARDSTMTKTLLTTARWGETGVSPYDNLDGWLDEQATLVGAAGSHVVMDKKAWQLFAADPKLTDRLDTTLANGASAIMMGFQPGAPGSPIYKGRVGMVEFYVYNSIYEDVDGSMKWLLPDYTVIIGAPAAYEGTPTYGAILDPHSGYAEAQWYSRNFIDNNPAGEFILTQSAPLPIPKRPNASMCITVR